MFAKKQIQVENLKETENWIEITMGKKRKYEKLNFLSIDHGIFYDMIVINCFISKHENEHKLKCLIKSKVWIDRWNNIPFILH